MLKYIFDVFLYGFIKNMQKAQLREWVVYLNCKEPQRIFLTRI